jgi:hypothetical protein
MNALYYGLAYVPFAYLSARYRVDGGAVAIAVLAMMCLIWTLRGYWAHVRLTPAAIVSGICTAGIIGTTIAALRSGADTVFAVLLLMRGGVLLLAPLADVLTGYRIAPQSVAASVMAATGVVLCNLHKHGQGATLKPAFLAILLLYIACYAVKLPIFSRAKRSPHPIRFLISEQTVAVALYTLYALGSGIKGFTAPAAGIGACSQLTGIYGGAVLLGRREHTATVPLNRAASMIAGLIATVALGQEVQAGQIVGFALLCGAIAVLQTVSRERH